MATATKEKSIHTRKRDLLGDRKELCMMLKPVPTYREGEQINIGHEGEFGITKEGNCFLIYEWHSGLEVSVQKTKKKAIEAALEALKRLKGKTAREQGMETLEGFRASAIRQAMAKPFSDSMYEYFIREGRMTLNDVHKLIKSIGYEIPEHLKSSKI